MIDTVSTHGNAYCNDPDYATFFGPPKQMVYYDWGLRAYVKATVQTSKTPRDRVQAADENEAMTPEPFDYSGGAPMEALKARKRNKIKRDAEIVQRLVEALREHGQMSAFRLAGVLHVGKDRPLPLLRAHPELFWYGGGPNQDWLLVGQEYVPPVRRNPRNTERKIAEYLAQHGPSAARTIAEALGRDITTVNNKLRLTPDVFLVVKTLPQVGQRPPVRLFGVVGVHDQEANA